MRAYEYKHIVGFEETNLVGNVYFANHVRWQGACREMFLRQHAPSILEELKNGLALITTQVSCEYLNEVVAFDEVTIQMRLESISQNRVAMDFEYWRTNKQAREMIARGKQQIACMRREGDALVPVPVPHALRRALLPYNG